MELPMTPAPCPGNLAMLGPWRCLGKAGRSRYPDRPNLIPLRGLGNGVLAGATRPAQQERISLTGGRQPFAQGGEIRENHRHGAPTSRGFAGILLKQKSSSEACRSSAPETMPVP